MDSEARDREGPACVVSAGGGSAAEGRKFSSSSLEETTKVISDKLMVSNA